ncbi:ankyrin repeat domain-containing protein 33B [Monodelphis domestica]|uniref:Ankyrin repeat domain 33B n=1 Tax=Monodelphis domestica TaxID=13616 RepID=F7DEG3_MONDO|nr:ankyrin repeat domain-containing protein 33B [Monodelphis domestica]XP_016286905.1 ankyrin repeat domain-containing protein 33B [Monodelphis domestica]
MGLLSGDCQEGGGSGGRGHGEQPASPGCVAEEESFPALRVGEEKEEDGAEEDYEEYVDFSLLPDARSIASDDSFYPPDGEDDWLERGESWCSETEDDLGAGEDLEVVSLFQAASTNNVGLLRELILRGPSAEEVLETDRNRRTGLIVACYQGFVDIVVALAECPHIDVNWQDNEGNTALITAAQAGHITITNYLLNYFPGLDLERRNIFGYTALMKAAMQGRTECIRALMLAGADAHATDPNKGMTPREWASYTGRFEAVCVLQRLLDRPCPEQFSEQYKLDWPVVKDVLVKPAEPKSCLQRLSECFRSVLSSHYVQEPEDGGVLDHMVRMTTSLYSPAVAIACKTVCPESPPCVGKRRFAVQEILRRQNTREVGDGEEDRGESHQKRLSSSQGEVVPNQTERRASLQPSPITGAQGGAAGSRKASLLPLHLLRRSSVRPGFVIPKVRINKAPTPTFQPERVKKKASTKDSTYLQIPKWRYKEAKEERRKAEEAEKKKAPEVLKERRVSPWKNRT